MTAKKDTSRSHAGVKTLISGATLITHINHPSIHPSIQTPDQTTNVRLCDLQELLQVCWLVDEPRAMLGCVVLLLSVARLVRTLTA
jgi:hypothetical protein